MTTHQPRVWRNNWRTVHPESLPLANPTLSVAVVIPAYACESTLPVTLASLAAQSYPEELLEVVVVDDGNAPAITLPDLRPRRTRAITAQKSWGRANALREGAEATDADVLFWLDSDMLAFRDHVAAQMRWHHAIDYAVVLGHKLFVDPVIQVVPSPQETHEAVAAGDAEKLFDAALALPHDWVEQFWQRTDDLTSAGPTAWAVHVGATASVHRAFYAETGGLDPDLKLGEDIELGYRLVQNGAVIIPELESRSWHLGPSTVMRRRDEVNRYNAPYLTDRISQLRYRRASPGRQYSVPYVTAVLDVTDTPWDVVRPQVHSILASRGIDLECLLVGHWSALDDRRRPPLTEELRELRMVQAEFRGDRRVTFVEKAPTDVFPSAFHLEVPAGHVVGEEGLGRLLRLLEVEHLGEAHVLLEDGSVLVARRTAAALRAARVGLAGEDPMDLMNSVYGVAWFDGDDFAISAVKVPE